MKKQYIFLFTIILGVFIMTMVSAISQPKAYWKFDESTGFIATDSVTGSYPITFTLQNWTTGLINNAFWLSNDNANTTSPVGDSAYSFSIWINRTGTMGTSGILMGSQDGSFQNGEFRLSPNTGEKLVFDAKDSGGAVISITTPGIGLNTWTHLVGTINTTGISLYVNNTLNASVNFVNPFAFISRNVTLGGGAGANQNNIKIDEFGVWNTTLNSSDVNTLYNGGAGVSYPQFIGVPITLDSPLTGSLNTSQNMVFNSTISSSDTLTNATLNIWYSNGSLFNQTLNIISGTSNKTGWIISGFNPNNYKWNVQACAAISGCAFASSNNTFTWGIENISSSVSSPVYETERTTYNITFNTASGTPTATLWWNGTANAGTITSLGTNYWLASYTQDIPNQIGLKNVMWNIGLGSLSYNNSIQNQNVVAANLTLCSSAPQNIPYLNLTFKNETNAQETVNGQFTGTFNYWIGGGSVSKSLVYSSSVDTPSYAFCFNPGNRTINMNLTSVYSNSYSPQRSYNLPTTILSNTTSNNTLFLLPSSIGSYVTFVVSNIAFQNIQGALVNISRPGIGLIEQGTTDSSGSVTFFMNPLFPYTLQASATGYPMFSSSITPTQALYTITLGQTSVSNTIPNYNDQIYRTFNPLDMYLMNNTIYNFNITINSTYWNIEHFGVNIINSSGSVLANIDSSSNGGFIGINFDTGNLTWLNSQYYWQINGTNTTFQIYHTIVSTEGSEHSIASFRDRLKSYLTGGSNGTGIFGLTTFSLNLIIFFIVLCTTGILSYKFGLTSPAAILGVMTGMLVLFDPILGLVTYPSDLLQSLHAGTMMLFLITIVFTIREAY